MTTSTIRWGIIGMGRFGAIHARAIASLHGSDLTAVCTRDPERLRRAQAEFNPRQAYDDYRRLLEDDAVDAVSITTHWKDHHEIAIAALNSGKHVLLEKPMASSGRECREILAAASSSSGKFMVGHICRFDPRVTLAKEAIEQGRIGRIVSMHAKRNLPKAAGSLRLDKTSPMMGDGVHDADIMMWFLDRAPSRVYGRYVRVDQFIYPDIGWSMLEFDEDAIGVVETVWRLPENTPTVIDARMQVVGTEGMLTIEPTQTGLTVLDPNGLKMQDTDYWPISHGRQVGVLSLELNYFADCIRRDETPQVITPAEAARAVMLMETAERSAASGQPLPFTDEVA